MTTPARIERELPGILGDLSAGPAPDYLDDVFGRTGRMRQRPAWSFPERWLPMADITRSRAFPYAPKWRPIAVALVIIALVVVAALAYVGSQPRRVPPPFGPAANGLMTYETGGDIYVGDPATASSRLLVAGVDDDHDPGFSPDGTLIAFIRSHDASSADLFTVRADGTDLKRVTPTSIESIVWSIWTPDSRHIGVSHAVGTSIVFETFDLDGHVQAMAPGYDVKSFQYRPPMGQEILFRADKDGVSGLFVMDASGANIHPVKTSTSPGNDLDLGNATYSADGSRIFFQSAVQVSPDNQCCQLWVMDADGSNAHQFPDDRVINAWEGVPSVSPDGRWVAFWRVTDTGQHASVVRADGTGPVTPAGPTLNGGVNFWWSPDSTKLIVTPQDDVDVARQYIADPITSRWTTSEFATRTLDQQRLAP
jgi:Tol biopolymer transport system component